MESYGAPRIGSEVLELDTERTRAIEPNFNWVDKGRGLESRTPEVEVQHQGAVGDYVAAAMPVTAFATIMALNFVVFW
jgi:hypothetical protein